MGNAIRALFAPGAAFLTLARDRLSDVAMSARVGIDIGKYVAPVRVLGPGFALMIQTLIAGAILAVVLLGARAAFGLYLSFKEGIRWW